MKTRLFGGFAIALILSSCMKTDVTDPVLILNRDMNSPHFLGEPYIDPGASFHDDQTCPGDINSIIEVENNVDINRYGTYSVIYSAADEAGNEASVTRLVDIILQPSDYFGISYNSFDTCSSGNYFYMGLIQDCDCNADSVTVGNIGDFGFSATFTLPLSGQYNESVLLDTTKAMVHFEGIGFMNVTADTLFWNYSIQDSVTTDVCRSVWIKNE